MPANSTRPTSRYGFVVIESTIAKGRIARIDASAALRSTACSTCSRMRTGRRMAGQRQGLEGRCRAADGSPFRPLYDDKIHFSGQPVALVLAEDLEIARFAASLVASNTKQKRTSPTLYAQRDQAVCRREARQSRAAMPSEAFVAAAVRHEAEYFIPTEHHNPMELFASTAVWEGDGKLTVYDKTQGVQNVQRYLCSVFEMKPDDVRVMSPYVGGGFGSGLRPQYQVVLAMLGALALKRSVRLVLTRQQMYGLGHRPATIERLALGAKADGTLDSLRHEAIAVTSQFEEFSPQRHRLGSAALQMRQREIRTPARAARRSHALRHARARRCDRCVRPRERDGRARRSAEARPLELRLRCYSDRDQNEDVPYTSKQLRECYRQGAETLRLGQAQP